LIPKFQYFRSRKHLQNVAALPCQCCHMVGMSQASHSNQAKHGKGRGIKASDEFTAAICGTCHHEIDQGRTMTRSERVTKWDEAHEKTVQELQRGGLWPAGVATCL
jgi:uncharacterized CHY-type Zn-finger protein